MKRLIFVTLFITSSTYCINSNNLEDAIQKSDIETVKEQLSSIPISKDELQRLYLLADDVLAQRRVQCLTGIDLQELTPKKIAAILCCIGCMCLGIGLGIEGLQTYKKINNPLPFLAMIPCGWLTIVGIILSHTMDLRKLHDNAIKIKQFIYKTSQR